MAQTIRCKAGLHHYNPEQHASCPYCRKVNVGAAETRRASDGVGAPPGVTRIASDSAGPVAAVAPAPMRSGEETRRVGPSGVSEDIQPVVGWLVCVQGPGQGKDYRIKAGKNAIGRDVQNSIQITGDNGISREGQAYIFYDDKSVRFHFKDGDQNQNLNYLNGETLLNPVALKKGDLIQMSDTTLMFIPLCDEDFTWSKV